MDLETAIKGYSDEQYSEALFQTLVTYLCIKGIIDRDEFVEYALENCSKILEMIKERDKEETKKICEKFMENVEVI